MKVALYGSRQQQPYTNEISALLRQLVLMGANVGLHRKLYIHLDELGVSLSGVSLMDGLFPDDVDVAISIGGDGTFLRTAAWVGSTGTSILGVNTGHLGYLSGLSFEQLLSDIEFYVSKDTPVESRTLIAVTRPQIRGVRYALNEVSVSKDDNASMISAYTMVNGRELAQYKADGLIVATPTGSTAYNLSVGGPIVEPTAPVWVLSPIAAHSLSMRPLVVNDNSVIDIRVDGRGHSFRLTLDGRSTTLPMGETVSLARAPFVINIVTCPGSEFPEPLRRKLMFN